MILLILEALAALAVLVGIVWWTMFSGRSGGELPQHQTREQEPDTVGAQEQRPTSGKTPSS